MDQNKEVKSCQAVATHMRSALAALTSAGVHIDMLQFQGPRAQVNAGWNAELDLKRQQLTNMVELVREIEAWGMATGNQLEAEKKSAT